MDAVEFLKEANRMHNVCVLNCAECEVEKRRGDNLSCASWVLNHPAEAIEIVEQWAKGHPRKTRQSEFLKMFPKAKVDANCVITICPYETCIRYKCDLKWGESTEAKCHECRKKYWLEEVEDNGD